MIVVISHRTMALALHLQAVRSRIIECKRFETMEGVSAPNLAAADAAFINEWLGVDERLCVLVPSENLKRHDARMYSRVVFKGLPSDILVQLGENLFGVRPELCFLQMASELSFAQLVRFGYDLCGTYAPGHGDLKTRYGLKPLTSVKKIREFLDQCDRVHGIHKARRAIKYVKDNSASPRESILATLFALPFSLGGFNAPDFEMNTRFDEARESRFPDLFWPSRLVDIEYDSDEFHDDKTRDAIRKNELMAAGIRVLTVTKTMLDSAQLTYGLALDFYGNAERSFRPVCKNYSEKRKALHKELSMDWYKILDEEESGAEK